VHPALLDAALHATALTGPTDEIKMPYAWTGVTLYSVGAATLRVRVAPSGGGGVSVWAVDDLGVPVLSVDSVVLRSVPADRVGGAGDGLLRVGWVRVVSGGGVVDGRVFRCEPASGGVAGAVRTAVLSALELLRSAGDERVVFATRTGDLSHAAVRGLVRSAQSESPGRYLLVDA